MQYAIFCYQAESQSNALTQEQDDAMMAALVEAKERINKTTKLGPVARLMSTKTAKTVREGRELTVFDGPFAETKEQLLGFYVVECETFEEAVEAARTLAGPRVAAGLTGALEVRPIRLFDAARD